MHEDAKKSSFFTRIHKVKKAGEEMNQTLDFLKQLAHGLAAQFGTTNATISHHLSVLRDAGLIDDEKRGKYIYYSLNTSVMEDIYAWVAGLLGGNGDETEPPV